MQYLVKEFNPGEDNGYKIHLADDFKDETSASAIWFWIRRAARFGQEISVYAIEDSVLSASENSMHEYLIADGRKFGPKLAALSVVWASDLPEWIDLLKGGECVEIYPITCVLDLS